MKIVNKQEFYKLPYGTLFSYYEPCIISGLMIKNNTIFDGETPIDFFYEDLIGNIECASSTNLMDILTNAELNETEIQPDFNSGSRDGIFNEDAMYLVYSSDDLQGLLNKIKSCVGY